MRMTLPARSCRFYVRRVCFHAEAVNPGFNPRYQCARLVRLFSAWDDFLDRAEAFGLSEKLAADIWNGREKSLSSSCPSLPAGRNHVPSFAGQSGGADMFCDARTEPFSCSMFCRGACLRAMPLCLARCGRYSLAGVTD